MQTWITTKIHLDTNKKEIHRFVFKEFTVNSAGDVLDETEFGPDTSVTNKRIYRYFETGDLQEYIAYDPCDKLLERHTFIENGSGEMDRIIYEYKDGHKTVKEFHYTDLGLADRVTLRDENNSVTGYEKYIFNTDGQIIEHIETDSQDNEVLKQIMTYDENGLVVLDKEYVEGKLTESHACTYDEVGNLIRKITTDHVHRFKVVDDYTYDTNGNMLHHAGFQNGTLIFENTCTYDDHNNLLTEELFEMDYWEKRIKRHERLIHELRG